jgi:hypothetical protein
MIHRGVQYSRAVSKFVKKFRRYPTSVEELESTNNIRFLRKRYKDPITGKDFKLLHYDDLPSFNTSGGTGTPVTDLVSQQQTASGKVVSPISGPASGTAEGETSELNRQASDSDSKPDTQAEISQTDENGSNAPEKPDPNQPLELPPNVKAGPGGLVVGVASISKQKSIRVFNKQDHYNQWKFIYDPSTDHTGISTMPSQPPLAFTTQRNQRQNEEAATQATGADSGPVDAPPGSLRGQQ